MPIQFDRRAGQFRGSNGRFVSKAAVQGFVNSEVRALEVELNAIVSAATRGRLLTADMQRQMAIALKESHIRQAALGAGGTKQMTPAHYGALGYGLSEQYQRIAGLGSVLSRGELSQAQIEARLRQYAESSRSAFWNANKRTHGDIGFNQAKRSLDPGAAHCAECLSYDTEGEWRPIGGVIAPGNACSCRGRCRCRISYRRFSDGKDNSADFLLSQVGRQRLVDLIG